MNAMELGALCDDLDLYPDEMLGTIAARLGFGETPASGRRRPGRRTLSWDRLDHAAAARATSSALAAA